MWIKWAKPFRTDTLFYSRSLQCPKFITQGTEIYGNYLSCTVSLMPPPSKGGSIRWTCLGLRRLCPNPAQFPSKCAKTAFISARLHVNILLQWTGLGEYYGGSEWAVGSWEWVRLTVGPPQSYFIYLLGLWNGKRLNTTDLEWSLSKLTSEYVGNLKWPILTMSVLKTIDIQVFTSLVKRSKEKPFNY